VTLPSAVVRPGALRATTMVVIAGAVAGGYIARRTGTDLGAASAPFFLSVLASPARHPWWPLPSLIAALAGAVVLSSASRLPGWAFSIGAFALALGARLGLAVAQRGVPEWWFPLTRPGAQDTEYPSAYYFMRGHVRAFVDHFAELVSVLPVHPSGHPVGAILAFYGLDSLTGSQHITALVLCALGALAVVPTLWLGRALADEASARRAVVLFALAPDTLIYGATSYDAAFVPITTVCAWLLVTRRVRLGALVAAAAFLLSYALALVPLWGALVLGRRGGLRAALWCAGVALAVLAAMALALGYDPVEALLNTHRAYERGIGGRRPQWYWAFGGPAAFLVLLGPLLAERLLAAAERASVAARALLACILLTALSGVIEAESERILQFAVPLAAVAAAPFVRSRRWLVIGLAIGLAQAYLTELHWDAAF
jgi:hypothetical protein